MPIQFNSYINPWLSNFYECVVHYDGVAYPSVENAYQAAKTADLNQRKYFETMTAREAKRAGRNLMLREDWEQEKDAIMADLVKQKFTEHPHLKANLARTNTAQLVHYCPWGDTYWGVNTRGVGQNKLGHMIMVVRDDLA